MCPTCLSCPPLTRPSDMEGATESHRSYICSFSGCTAAYNKQWKLDAHLCTHTGVRPYRCERGGCGKTFCSRYHLDRHDLSHSGLRPFRCPADGCGEAFTTNANLTRHQGRAHGPVPDRGGYVCPVEGCELGFRKNKQLRAHLCEQHTQPAPYPCPQHGCHMSFAFPSKLRRHLKVHRGYPCEEGGCTFTGRTWTDYLQHRKEQHRRVFKCDQCSKEFRDSWFLQQHMRVHADTRVVFLCPREGCDRSFTTMFNLESHVSSFHEGLRPWVCDHVGCGKKFAMKQSLHRHSIVHDPQRKKLKKPRASRSLASRLSGYKETKKVVVKKKREPDSVARPVQDAEPRTSVELVSLLQDTLLQCNPAADTHGLTTALAAPLTM